MHLEEFSEGTTFLHRIDPRVKILTLPILIIWMAITEKWLIPFFGLVSAVILSAAGRLNPGDLMRRMVPVNLFLLFLWLVVPFSTPGNILFQIAGMRYTLDGVWQTSMISLKANAIVLLTIAVLGTIPIFKLTHALRHLKVPDKLVHLFFFCYRYLTVLHRDYSNLMDAMKARGFKPGTNRHTYKTYANMVGMLIVRSFEHSEMIYQAMLCRGFNGKFPLFQHFRFRSRDAVYLALNLVLFLIFTSLQFGELLR